MRCRPRLAAIWMPSIDMTPKSRRPSRPASPGPAIRTTLSSENRSWGVPKCRAAAAHRRSHGGWSASRGNLRTTPRLLRSVRISALALLKMAMHAKSGGNIEVMGVMQVRTVLHGCRLLRLPYSAAPNTVSSPPSQPLCTCTNGLQGKIQGGEFIVIDSFALPVEGTETRVNAQAEAFEYMVDFLETNQVGFV